MYLFQSAANFGLPPKVSVDSVPVVPCRLLLLRPTTEDEVADI